MRKPDFSRQVPPQIEGYEVHDPITLGSVFVWISTRDSKSADHRYDYVVHARPMDRLRTPLVVLAGPRRPLKSAPTFRLIYDALCTAGLRQKVDYPHSAFCFKQGPVGGDPESRYLTVDLVERAIREKHLAASIRADREDLVIVREVGMRGSSWSILSKEVQLEDVRKDVRQWRAELMVQSISSAMPHQPAPTRRKSGGMSPL